MISGSGRAIATRAEAVFSQLAADDQTTAERLFTRLVRVTTSRGEADTRHRTMRSEVGDTAWSIAQQFAHAANRLLVISIDAGTGEESVELVHEALIRG